MPNSNVPSDKTVYDFDSFGRIEVTEDYNLILDTLTHDLLPIAKGLGLPKGRHLVKLTVTAEVLKSEAPYEPVSLPPSPDDLRQERMAEEAAAVFEVSNSKFPAFSGVTDLF